MTAQVALHNVAQDVSGDALVEGAARARPARPRARAAASSSPSSGRRVAASRRCSRSSPDWPRRPRAASRSRASPSRARRPTASASCSRRTRRLPWLDVDGQHRVRAAPLGTVAGRARHARARRIAARGPLRFRHELSVAALRRHAPARMHRAHAGDAAAAHPARRAVRRARPADAAPDGRRAAADVARDRRDDLSHHARARRGDDARRPHRGDVRAAGRLIDIVETHWPRERDSRIVEHPEFGAITARLWKTLREESLRAMGHG